MQWQYVPGYSEEKNIKWCEGTYTDQDYNPVPPEREIWTLNIMSKYSVMLGS
jgi:hypothetical protein